MEQEQNSLEKWKADALAQLSEGWCAICHTPFRDREGYSEPRCQQGFTPEQVRCDIETRSFLQTTAKAVRGNLQGLVKVAYGGGGGSYAAGGVIYDGSGGATVVGRALYVNPDGSYTVLG
jgi:hypothetical protein